MTAASARIIGGGGGFDDSTRTDDTLPMITDGPATYSGGDQRDFALVSCAHALLRATGTGVPLSLRCTDDECTCGRIVVGTVSAGSSVLRGGGGVSRAGVGLRCVLDSSSARHTAFDLAQFAPGNVAGGAWIFDGAGRVAPLCACHTDELDEFIDRCALHDYYAQGTAAAVQPDATALVLACMHLLTDTLRWRSVDPRCSSVSLPRNAVDVTRGLMALARLRESTAAVWTRDGDVCRRCALYNTDYGGSGAAAATSGPNDALSCSGLVAAP